MARPRPGRRGRKNLKTPFGGTDKTDETPAGEVLSVSSVRQTGVTEKISGPADGGSNGFVSFVSSAKGAFSEKFPAPLPAPEPPARPPVAEAETPEAAVARLLDGMAAENAARRDWWREPDPERGSGKVTMRSIVTGDEITIDLRTGRTMH